MTSPWQVRQTMARRDDAHDRLGVGATGLQAMRRLLCGRCGEPAAKGRAPVGKAHSRTLVPCRVERAVLCGAPVR